MRLMKPVKNDELEVAREVLRDEIPIHVDERRHSRISYVTTSGCTLEPSTSASVDRYLITSALIAIRLL